MNPLLRPVAQAALLLGGIGLLAAGLLSGMQRLTAERIAQAERQARLRALAVVLPPERYDNDPLEDAIEVQAPFWLGSGEALTVWRARRQGQPGVLVLETVAPDGYSGEIRLLLGVDPAGRITGARVTRHRETPGLGDAIEAERSGWINRFAGRSLGEPPAPDWKVRRDGGAFDQFSGATVTPRAVVAALRRTLEFVGSHGSELYAAQTGTRLRFGDAPGGDER